MNTFPLPSNFSTWESFDNCSLEAGRQREIKSSYKEVVTCFIFQSHYKMLAVCFLSYFPQWEIVTTYTDNCSLDAGRNDA